MALFRQGFEQRDVNGYSNEEFMRLLGITNLSVDKSKLGEITYFTCCKLLSESLAKLPLKLYKESEKGVVKATEHYLYNKLKLRPNPYMSAWNFWSTVELYRNHFGNAFVYMDIVKGFIQNLYVLSNSAVQIWVDNAGIISKNNAIWYIYTDTNGKEYKIHHENMMHFKTSVSIDGGITGLAVQDILKINLENAQYGQQFTNNYFKNGLFAKGLLQYTGDIDPTSMKKMQNRFEEMSNGIKNAGKILPVPLGFSFTTLDTKMSDSQFLEINKYTALQIGAAFGIKPNQLNEQGKYANIEMQQLDFYVETLLSNLTMYEQEISYKTLISKERNSGYFWKFNVDVVVRADMQTRMSSYGTAIGNGIMTVNEVREKEDLPNIDGGDILVMNGSYIPISMVGRQYVKENK